MLTQRQLLILDAIIRDYTNIGEPIGSKTLQNQLPVHVSSATIRNEMAVLERNGFIMKEHSSSGRVPSLKGYRYYIDNIVEPEIVEPQALHSIQSSFSNEFQKVDEIVAVSAKILSELTNYTAFTLKPEAKEVRLEGFRLVPLGNQQVMVILVTSDGGVENQLFNLPPGMHGEELEAVVRVINNQVVGLPLKDVTRKLQASLPLLTKYLQQPEIFIEVFSQMLDQALCDQVYIDGKMNLLNLANSENLEEIKHLYTLFEHDTPDVVTLLDDLDQDISVTFGNEQHNSLVDYSLISATYDVGAYGKGKIAILGPTNMPYSKMLGLLTVFRKELANKMIDYYRECGK
ncbi:heat-inducible transcriptional repressor HrcA [Ligilactobacillus ceti]|nr:heat-inducible transcriptional repressor HrcA [Ligilactobacillus ceti]